MKNKKLSLQLLFSLITFFVLSLPVFAFDFPIVEQNWKIQYNTTTKTVDFEYNKEPVLLGVFVRTKIAGVYVSSSDYENVTLTDEDVSDNLGDGKKYTVKYCGKVGLPDLSQVFYFYQGKKYFLTETYVESSEEISSNYIAPIVTMTRSSFLPKHDANRILTVPFDNDGWVRFSSSPLTTDTLSFEVTAVFNGETRKGIILGSVEHNIWKTGIRFSTADNQYIDKLECFGGITHNLTRDIEIGCGDCSKTSKEHGKVRGKKLKSPMILIGVFDDWRRGMEIYGEVNNQITPRRAWDKGTPFGWNSWGAMEKKVNYSGARDVSAFIKDELQPRNFENKGVTYIGLDSFWDINFSDGDLMNFVKSCNQKGQEAGIYWTPFSYWSNDGERYIEGTNGKYKYKDAFLYANGKVRSIAGRALDPTHPGVKMRIAEKIADFKKWGFKYIKLDFLNNGTQEADSFYESGITTGIQAYNHGMQYLVEQCGDDIFLALSIAPTFPSQYGHSKRISCDVWGAMNDVWSWTGSTEYLLNSLSFGWWLDRVYPFNDADHIVMYDEAANRKYSEGENRARVTSSVITGLYMLGDNLSLKGSFLGTQTARDRVLKFATNPDINEIARYKKSFYPVDGHKASGKDRAESMFVMDTDKYFYFVVFNFNARIDNVGTMELSRLGIDKNNFEYVKELWTGSESVIGEKIVYDVPIKDVRVYRLTKKRSTNIGAVRVDNLSEVACFVNKDLLQLNSKKEIFGVKILSSDGKILLSNPIEKTNEAKVDITSLNVGMYIVSVQMENGHDTYLKFIR